MKFIHYEALKSFHKNDLWMRNNEKNTKKSGSLQTI